MDEVMDELMERSHGPSDCLLPPDADFIIDQQDSPHSGLEVSDRLTYLEQRVHMQEDEIQLLKMAMADVLKRLNISEEQTAALRRPSAKAVRPVSLSLAPKASVSSLRKSSSSTLPPSPSSRNYSPSAGGKRTPVGATKDSASAKTKSSSSSSTSGCRKLLEIKSTEGRAAVAGARRVTHCKVTMQIYLSPLSRRTGSAEPVALPALTGPQGPSGAAVERRPVFVHKSSCQSYKSPTKSPSQYFQICY